jgi:hypothetical protein
MEPTTVVMKAIRYLNSNRVDEAIQFLEKTLQYFPGNLQALTTLGHAYR